MLSLYGCHLFLSRSLPWTSFFTKIFANYCQIYEILELLSVEFLSLITYLFYGPWNQPKSHIWEDFW